MLQLTMFEDSTRFTSSQGSADGPTPCALPGGQTTSLSGPGVAHASRSVQQGSSEGKRTSGIFGPSSPASSASVALQSCLESRLKERLGTGGLMEYSETWKEKVTPAGRWYWAHTASGRRTSGSGCIGWPTPSARDWKSDRSQKQDHEIYANEGKVGKPLARLCLKHLGAGPYLKQGDAETPGACNPAFVRWLMGFPPEWCDCAVMAMQSFPKLRRRLSAPAVR
jgi:hypothetical protein